VIKQSHSGYISKGNDIDVSIRHSHSHITAALFTITKIGNQPKFLPEDEWVMKMCIYVHDKILFSNKEN
jgi:hypothetical protein